jgi:hypothetical protein
MSPPMKPGDKKTISAEEHYVFENDWTMRRDEPYPYNWVLRDETGERKDTGQAHDVIKRNGLKVRTHWGM